jgi:hypothetical protein
MYVMRAGASGAIFFGDIGCVKMMIGNLEMMLRNPESPQIGDIGVQTNSRAEFCNANTRIAGATLKQSSGTLPTGKPASKEIRSMRFSFGTSCRLAKASASASALPGGNGNSNGSFNNVGNNGNWWSSSENNAANAWNRNMNRSNANVNRNNNDKTKLYSVRCVQDCFKICASVARAGREKNQ